MKWGLSFVFVVGALIALRSSTTRHHRHHKSSSKH
jgi:hypothetical protein